MYAQEVSFAEVSYLFLREKWSFRPPGMAFTYRYEFKRDVVRIAQISGLAPRQAARIWGLGSRR